MDRSHLLARQFGGTGGRRNMMVLWRDVNQVEMTVIEREIAADLNAGQSVYYNVIPQYGTNTTAPNPQIAPYMPTSVEFIWGTQGIPLQGETLDNIP